MSGLNPYRGELRTSKSVTDLMWRVNFLETSVRVPTGDPSSPDGVFTKQWQHNIPFTPSPISGAIMVPGHQLPIMPYRRILLARRTDDTTVPFEETYYATIEVVPVSVVPGPSTPICTTANVHINIYSDQSLLYSVTQQTQSVIAQISKGLIVGGVEQFYPSVPGAVVPSCLSGPVTWFQITPVWNNGYDFLGPQHLVHEPRFSWVDSLSDFGLYLSFWPVKNGRWGGGVTSSSPIYSGASDAIAYLSAVGSSLTFSSTMPSGASGIAASLNYGYLLSDPPSVSDSDEILTGLSLSQSIALDPAPTLDYFRMAYFAQGTTSGDKPLDPTEWTLFRRNQTSANIGSFPEQEVFTYSELPPLDTDALVCPNTITQIRDAIEAIAEYFENPGTGNPYNWTDASADNLYFVACGDRTQFGAQGGARYTWTRSAADMLGTPTFDIDIAEIDACVTQLEGSALV